MADTTTSQILNLPAELRIQIYSHLIQIAVASSSPYRAAALERGFSSGVGHITLLQDGPTWRSVTIAKPPGFSFLAPAILRVSKSIHNEVMDFLYSNILWVINIQTLRPIAPPFFSMDTKRSGIAASPDKKSMFMQWIAHVHIRQHIRPEEDLVQKAQALRSLLGCLNPRRKSSQVTLQFDSIHLVHDPEYPRTKKPEYNWQLYENELKSMRLGHEPQFKVSHYWLEAEGQERFDQLAAPLGGKVNSQYYIYW
ncbi:hypothetical protein Slin15195_G080670 [Septoria linicola]|uniref:Uncharacterized protein n=1 Tax=Septoria linicola TaxID=215465 RepID=A0A9Q9AZ84_9PEZI|nr:hypothetical protein Slin15195_G080670 [Septoria linicola]